MSPHLFHLRPCYLILPWNRPFLAQDENILKNSVLQKKIYLEGKPYLCVV